MNLINILLVSFSFAGITSTLTITRIDPGTTNSNPLGVPVVIWHGLSDSYANPGLDKLAEKINLRYPSTPVYKIRLAESDSQDRRATWFGSANEQVKSVCEQLSRIDELSRGFDGIGLSQGGQLMRAYIERCNQPRVRNLITLGSQHMGVSGHQPCTSLFDLGCHILHKLIESGTVYGTYAQQNVIPAQYFRDQSNLRPYMDHNEFLRDINNERGNDTQPIDSGSDPTAPEEDGSEYYPRNQTYKHNFQSLNNFIMFKFTEDTLVIPPTSAYFTIPNVTDSSLPDGLNPIPIALQDLPIYQEDYIGLKTLDEAGKIHYGTCFGVHMEIDEDCWENVMDWLGDGEGRQAESEKTNPAQQDQLVLQPH
ncbi:hypothetical protein MJO28_015479 [Puccinia striiformis f. sp. tritici]|uniref:Palmitoyl-protein thioesterase 1 n=3 Tax=Puccinia striiformis TaxID=27350 RepID=A0A0L0USE9_9BASI|nr:hypothetical protein Pst134EA_029503 [Puccinia striiformis f. sp. tritici]KNE89674.1 hypothetical protein PSTG_16871 [Puccinia striiformis f. sp. tritici PST-78]POW06179.1 hypothetical protein PSHT_10493 [Puccinia striiformis]KAH9441495.1 hypothetical protein Pst134EB_030161 [Puccinia striiformis f. sp. tritici]KAH9447466.1 hypothetical protein Pst134EA_029503 [Puccinia striiformis f. sp. tritici]KAI7936575.1 hypothetical protein MJO29_015878 [Puccinia striiformis f. sp. tritici]